MREKYHKKLKEFKKTCKSKKYFFLQQNLQEIESVIDDSKSFWEKWKTFGENESKDIKMKISGKKLYDHFLNLHQEIDSKNVEQSEIPNNFPTNENLNKAFSKKEFKKVVQNLKCNKSEGYDCISSEMIKNSPENLLNAIYRFLNLCLEKSIVPNSWCLELISLIHKKGDINDLSNYRGICVSSPLLKILCTLLNERVQIHCSENKLINKNQIGFQKGSRTSDHILTLKTLVKKYVTIGKEKLYACFVDFQKAFDSIWHKGLFYKLQKVGINGNSLNLIKDLYKKTKCAIKTNGRITDFFRYYKGVRQGCPLSSVLFNLYVNDIFDTIEEHSTSDVFLNEHNKINALMYADDLVLISRTKEGLQRQIDSLYNYCKKWKLNINIKKTKSMVFNRGNNLIKTVFNVDDTPIENVKKIKYLGFTISAKNCSFQHTIDDLTLKANRAIYAIKSKVKLSTLPTKLAIKIFKSQIVPILLYGSEVWGPYINLDYLTWENSNTERMQTQFLKQILGCNFKTSNDMVRADTGCRPLLNMVIKRFISYTKNLLSRKSALCYDSIIYENGNSEYPNFCKYSEMFNLNILELMQKSKQELNKICAENYDRFWKGKILASTKAASFNKFKNNITLEKHLHLNFNLKHKIALSRFRLSNHPLMIEKGRHLRIEKNERKCYFCKDKIEDEEHFLINCPLYSPSRLKLENVCTANCNRYNELNNEQKFIFLMSNEDENVIKQLGRFISDSLNIRDRIITYFFL